MRSKSRFIALLSACLFAGCSVTPKQIYELRNFLPSAEKREAERLAAMAWRLSFAGAEYLVWPAPTAEGGLVFIGAQGLRVVFDGREVTRIEGLPGAFGPFVVDKRGKERDFRRGGRRSFTVRCNEPTDWQVEPTRSGWRMECRGSLNGVPVQTQHTVEWGASGEPVKILSTVAPGSRPLSLRKTD